MIIVDQRLHITPCPMKHRSSCRLILMIIVDQRLHITPCPMKHRSSCRLILMIIVDQRLHITPCPMKHRSSCRLILMIIVDQRLHITRCPMKHGGGGVDPIPCVSTHRISDPRSGPAQLLPPHVKQRSHPHGVRPQIPDR